MKKFKITVMKYQMEHLKEFFRGIKFPKINLPKINWSTLFTKKPSRGLVVTVAVLIELILMFVALWLFDERTVFANDYMETRYSGEYLHWGWYRKGVAITLVLMLLGWLFAIFNEFAAYNKKDRTFYKLYHRNKY